MRSFRNLADADLAVPPAGCVVVGRNGQGKTSLIEALLYCEVFRSCRGAGDQELVRFGSDGFHVRVSDSGSRVVTAGYDGRTKRKKVTVDSAEPDRLSEAIGIVRGVVLSPADVSLVAGGPRERRHYLDVLLALTVRGYLEALATYRRALKHRAHAAPDAAEPWERMLAQTGAVIVEARRAFVERWAAAWGERCRAMGEHDAPVMAYASRTEGTAEALRAALERARERDLARGRTSVGPHRDDLRLQLGGHDLRHYGSAGQQRTAALALRLIEAAAQRDQGGPVTICLDDAFAELDEGRSSRLGEVIEGLARTGCQVVAAVPKESDVPGVIASLPRWRVEEGRVEQ